jgi:hypothetical protein
MKSSASSLNHNIANQTIPEKFVSGWLQEDKPQPSSTPAEAGACKERKSLLCRLARRISHYAGHRKNRKRQL